MRITIALAALALAVAPALAHETKGAHGGRQVDAGKMHVELVTKGPTVDVYVADGEGKPVDVAGYKGLAILAAGGKPARVPLAPSGDHLTGAAASDLGRSVTGAVLITSPAGATSSGKFD